MAQPLLIPLRDLRGVLPEWQINAQASGQAVLPSDTEDWLLRRLGRHRRTADEALSRTLLPLSPTKGPAPTSWIGIVQRDSSGPAHTYAFQFGNREVWKIGYTQDIKGRLGDVNKHIPHEEIREHWRHAFHQPWASPKLAHEMEQRVLKSLEHYRSDGERVRCSEQTMKEAWVDAVVAVRRLADQP